MIADTHVHSRFSDGRAAVADMVAAAARLRLPAVGLADHLVPPPLDGTGYGVDPRRLGEYEHAVRAAGEAEPSVTVLAAVEVDYAPGVDDVVSTWLDRCSFDYVMGSVHFVDGATFDTTASLADPVWQHVDALWLRYYELVAEAAATGLFQVIGHFDLPKKFGRLPHDVEAVGAAARTALRAVAVAGTALELNTSGWRAPAGEAYPAPDLLAHACRLGIPLTIGSDAHVPDEVGAGLDRAVRAARAAGYTRLLDLGTGGMRELP